MELDAEKLVKAFAEKLDLSNFKGDIVAFKHVENEINSVEKGGIGVYYANGKKKPFDDAETQDDEPPAKELNTLDRDEKIKRTILKMQEEGLFKNVYDYTWIMLFMNEVNKYKTNDDYKYKSLELPTFNSSQSFVNYLNNTLQLNNTPSRATIGNQQNNTNGTFPWTFTDTSDENENKRRNHIVTRFISCYNTGK